MFGQPNSPSALSKYAGYQNVYSFLTSSNVQVYEELKYFPNYLNQNNTKNALHVGNAHFEVVSAQVQSKLRDQFMKSVEPNLTALIDGNYKVLLFNGNLDIIVGVTSLNGILENKGQFNYHLLI